MTVKAVHPETGTEITLDPNTNLPALPEGYWWRVQKEVFNANYGVEYFRVSLMHKTEKLTYWRNKPTGKFIDTEVCRYSTHWDDYSSSENPEQFVFNWVCDLWVGKAAPYFRRLNQTNLVADLLGDYPPKSLDTERVEVL